MTTIEIRLFTILVLFNKLKSKQNSINFESIKKADHVFEMWGPGISIGLFFKHHLSFPKAISQGRLPEWQFPICAISHEATSQNLV